MLTMHKTLLIDWLTYVQNILQPSFDVVCPRYLPTVCVCRDPALHSNSACTVLKAVCRVNGLLLSIHKHAGLLDVVLINKI